MWECSICGVSPYESAACLSRRGRINNTGKLVCCGERECNLEFEMIGLYFGETYSVDMH